MEIIKDYLFEKLSQDDLVISSHTDMLFTKLKSILPSKAEEQLLEIIDSAARDGFETGIRVKAEFLLEQNIQTESKHDT